MPRAPRVELEGAIHHVTMRGNGGRPIFLDDRDRCFLLGELDLVARDYDWTWLSYCLMSNHAHLVIETRQRTLGLGMRRLAGRHAQAFNRRHDRHEHVFGQRFGSRVVQSDEYFAQLLRYVARNPVKAGLCTEAAAWPWSSHRLMLRDAPAVRRASRRVDALLACWGGEPGTRYTGLFDSTFPLAERYGDDSPWERRPVLAELLERMSQDDAMRAARDHGYRLTEIAAAVGVSTATVWRRTQRPTG